MRFLSVMRYIRHHFLVRFLCGLVAAIILNFAVDAPDLYDNHIPEDLSYNDIESVVEWVLESVLQIEDAVVEHDDNDQNSPLKIDKHLDLFYDYSCSAVFPIFIEHFSKPARNFGDPNFSGQSACDELLQPPEA